MKRGGTVLALGLGLLAASLGRAGDGDIPNIPGAPPVAGNGGNGSLNVVPGHLPAVAGNGAPCGGGCCGASRGSCLHQLLNWFTYRGGPAPPCCRTGCLFCCACYCPPPVYTFFLGTACREGAYYGSYCGGCGCGGGGGGSPVVPPPPPLSTLPDRPPPAPISSPAYGLPPPAGPPAVYSTPGPTSRQH